MALKGTLKDFSIADIFQLIAHQQKSGSLYLTNENQVCHIMFDAGSVVIARFKQSNNHLMLGNMLLKAGILEESQLQEALDNQQSTLRSIGDILLSMNYITPDILRKFIKLQIDEVLFILFQWTEGLYEFVPEGFNYNKKILQVHRSEQLLLDGFRMLDEWPAVLKKVVSLNAVYKTIVDTSNIESSTEDRPKDDFSEDEIDMAFQEYDENEQKEEKPDQPSTLFTEEEKNILQMIDGRRSVQDIVYMSALGTFNTCSTIASLIDKSALLKMELSAPSREDTQAAFKSTYLTKKTKLYRLIIDIIVIATIVISLPTLIHHYYSNIKTETKIKQGFLIHKDSNPLSLFTEENKKIKLKFALELFKINFDVYPDNLDELVREGYIQSSESTKNIYYRKFDNSYALIP